jgi:putative ABC transport system permease protein
MRWLTNLWFRVQAIFGRNAMERGLEEEVAFHLEMEARKLEAEGHPPAEARRLARVRFGGVERFTERTRESWGVTALHDLGGDVRFAWRQLRAHPAFSLLAALTLALGIGGTVAIFSVVEGLLLRPLPVHDESRLTVFWMDYNWRGVEFDFVKERARAWESLAAYSNDAVTLHTDAGSSLLMSTVASSELFDVLGARPLLGRTFRPGEDRPGAEPTIVLSYGTWQQDFGGDRDIVGRRIDVDGRPTTVIGVMPEGFWFPTPDMKAWVPLHLDPADPDYQGNGWLVLVGRLAPGVASPQVQDDLASLASALGDRFQYPAAWDKTRDPHVTPLREYVLGSVRPALLLLLGAVALVLLTACANVAALVLTRTLDRSGEMAVRTALGAGRARLARQILTESILLGLLAGGVGTALAAGLFDVLVASLPLGDGLASTLSLDGSTLAFALVLAVGAGALVSLAPMRGLLAGDLSGWTLGERRQGGGSAGSGRAQGALVVAEVLLAVVLSTGAALLIRSVDRLRGIDPGLDPRGVLTVELLTGEQALDAPRRDEFLRDVVAGARALPGVTAAGLINRVPIRDGGWQATVAVAGRPDLDGTRRPNAFYRPVTPGTFDALGARIVRGRGILPTDDATAPRVAVVNEAFARRMWGDQDPVGRTITRNGFASGDIEVVGVVRDIAVDRLVGETPMAAYYPWAQTMEGSPFGILVVRTGLDPEDLARPLRALVGRLEPAAAIGRVETMSQVVDGAMSETIRLRFFLGLFSAMGLLMGSVGIYGVVSYGVRRRSAEFGIRMALGAQPRRLLGDVVRRGMLPVLLGVGSGVAVALLASRLLARFLYGVAPTDPVAVLSAAIVLAVVGLLAAAVPAWRACGTDPAEALRAE